MLKRSVMPAPFDPLALVVAQMEETLRELEGLGWVRSYVDAAGEVRRALATPVSSKKPAAERHEETRLPCVR